MSDEPIKRGRGRPRKPKPDTVPPKGKVGRPKSPIVAERQMTVREYAMTHVFAAIDVWAEIMADEDQPGAARAAAAAHVVNRAIGQPAQAQPQAGDTPDQTLQRIERVIVDVPVPSQKKVREPAK